MGNGISIISIYCKRMLAPHPRKSPRFPYQTDVKADTLRTVLMEKHMEIAKNSDTKKVKPKVQKISGRATARTLGGAGRFPEYFGGPPRSGTMYG